MVGVPEGAVLIMATDTERYEFLKKWAPNHLIIDRGDNNMNYESVEEWLIDNVCTKWAKVLPGEYEKIIESGSLWTLQVYPDTPIGFYARAASTLDALLDWAIEANK